jgi:hypothetical protein
MQQRSLSVNRQIRGSGGQHDASATAAIIEYLVDFGVSEKEARIQ